MIRVFLKRSKRFGKVFFLNQIIFKFMLNRKIYFIRQFLLLALVFLINRLFQFTLRFLF